jgi:sec-independent protein translocase protein TatA
VILRQLPQKERCEMGGLSVWHWLIFLAVALLLFGGSGKISSIMGDVAKGIKSFKKGMSEDEETAKKEEPAKKDEPAKVIENAAAAKPIEQHTAAEPSKTGWSPKA